MTGSDRVTAYPRQAVERPHPPAGYVADHLRVRLGGGGEVSRAAWSALGRRDQFRLGWAVAVAARVLEAWWLNACRVVYAVDEDGPVRRAGLAAMPFS